MTASRKPPSTAAAIATAATIPSKKATMKLSDAEHPHIWMVIGPAGCGKSTIGKYVADTLDLPFLEGDEVSLSIPSVV